MMCWPLVCVVLHLEHLSVSCMCIMAVSQNVFVDLYEKSEVKTVFCK
jgi:hypothetical protein